MRCELDLRVGTDILVRPRANTVRPYGVAFRCSVCAISSRARGAESSPPYGLRFTVSFAQICNRARAIRESPLHDWCVVMHTVRTALAAVRFGRTQFAPTGLRFAVRFLQNPTVLGRMRASAPTGLRFAVGIVRNPTVLGCFVKRPYELCITVRFVQFRAVLGAPSRRPLRIAVHRFVCKYFFIFSSALPR